MLNAVRRLWPIFLVALFPSCISAKLAETEGRIVEALDSHRVATLEAYADHSEGAITAEELDEELDEIREERNQTVADAWEDLEDHVKAEVERVQMTAKAAAGGILGGGPLVDLLAAIGTSIAGGAYTTNRLRDGKRRMRGEPVGNQQNA